MLMKLYLIQKKMSDDIKAAQELGLSEEQIEDIRGS